jgi:hypothetical protein
MCAQQGLALFRTQHIVKLALELDTNENRLTGTVYAEHGALFNLDPTGMPPA